MAENNVATDFSVNNTTRFKEAVCIEAGRIFDSCSDKDCLEDLQVFFTESGQTVINESTLIKCKSAEVLDVYLTVEPVPFNKGFFAVDMTFYFRAFFNGYSSPIATPVTVAGLAYYSKKVILFGSEGNVKTFYSGDRRVSFDQSSIANMPTASVKAVDPIALGFRICDVALPYVEALPPIPDEIAAAFDGPIVATPEGGKIVLVTLGVFTIVTLERSVQLMIPAYDYCVPEKDCVTNTTQDDPCEMFKRIKFPVQEFFPENMRDIGSEED